MLITIFTHFMQENTRCKNLRAKSSRGMTTGSTRLGAIQAVAEKTVLSTESAVTTLTPVPRHKQFWEVGGPCMECYAHKY